MIRTVQCGPGAEKVIGEEEGGVTEIFRFGDQLAPVGGRVGVETLQ